jgi:hypothetical protein
MHSIKLSKISSIPKFKVRYGEFLVITLLHLFISHGLANKLITLMYVCEGL